MVVGDFNEIFKSSEKFRGNCINHNRPTLFWDCINQSNLVDLGFKGSKFTWTNKRFRNKGSLILEGLDRCLANHSWIDLFPKASVTYLPRTHSNHSPMLITISKHNIISSKPFRMETIWCSHPTFPDMVKGTFLGNTDLTQATTNFQPIITSWNREIFGNLFQKKKKEAPCKIGGYSEGWGIPL